MPRDYRFKCQDCNSIESRYRNAKRCRACGGLLERENLSPWQRIIVADTEGTGIHLSAWEVSQLAADGAIQTVAENDSIEFEEGRIGWS